MLTLMPDIWPKLSIVQTLYEFIFRLIIFSNGLKFLIQDNVVMVDCLRQKSVDEILRVDLMAPQHLTAFGPIIDGIVVPSEPKQLMQSRTVDSNHNFASNSMGNTNSYDLLFGVTRVEAPFIFSANEERHGIDLSRRDRILRTLVRNLFDYHQQVRHLYLCYISLFKTYTNHRFSILMKQNFLF
jgi:hypothetical protein